MGVRDRRHPRERARPRRPRRSGARARGRRRAARPRAGERITEAAREPGGGVRAALPPPGAHVRRRVGGRPAAVVSRGPPSEQAEPISFSSGTMIVGTRARRARAERLSRARELRGRASSVSVPPAGRRARPARPLPPSAPPPVSRKTRRRGGSSRRIRAARAAASPCVRRAASGSRGVRHPDRLVQADRGHVLGAGRRGRPSAPARGAGGRGRQPSRSAAPAHVGIDPDLLELHGVDGVHADASALKRITPSSSQPARALLLDLAPRAPAEAVRVPRQRVEPELLLGARARTRA